VFCDVEDGTGLLDPRAAASLVGPRTAAVLPVHLYGQACDPRRAARPGPPSRPAPDRGLRAGAWRSPSRPPCRLAWPRGLLSFYPSKNLGALGDGGAIVTSDPELAQRARELRDLGQARKGVHVLAGYNERLDALQAAMLRVKLPHLDRWNEARREHASRYRGLLAGRHPTVGGARRG